VGVSSKGAFLVESRKLFFFARQGIYINRKRTGERKLRRQALPVNRKI
jgi:hypothetical protein